MAYFARLLFCPGVDIVRAELRVEPLQLRPDFPRRDASCDHQAIERHSAFTSVAQLHMNMGKQMVSHVHHDARCRQSAQNRHATSLVQQLHYSKVHLRRLDRLVEPTLSRLPEAGGGCESCRCRVHDRADPTLSAVAVQCPA